MENIEHIFDYLINNSGKKRAPGRMIDKAKTENIFVAELAC